MNKCRKYQILIILLFILLTEIYFIAFIRLTSDVMVKTNVLEEDYISQDEMSPAQEEALPEYASSSESDPSVGPRSTLLDPTSIVVYNFTELRDALINNNSITTVYFGDNITMTAGITVNSSKANVTIDGTNPLVPGSGPFTLTDMNSTAQTSTIFISSNTGPKNVTVRNMKIVGKNFYGSVSVSTAATNVTVTYDNIDYSGPQLSYNRYGTSRYLDSIINITTTNGNAGLTVEELGEVKNVVFGGNVTVYGSSTTVSLLWFIGSGCTLDILPDSNVLINITNNYMIFSDGGQVDCTVGNNAKFNIITKYGVFYNSDVTLHQFGKFTINNGAHVEIYQSARNIYDAATATIKMKKGLTVNPEADFYVTADYASATPLIRFTANGVGANFFDPGTVLLSNTNGKLFDWSTGSGTIFIEANVVDYWTSTATLSQLKNFSRMPQYYWSKASGDNLTLSALVSSTTTSSVSSNFDVGADSGTAPSTTTMNMITARMLSFGIMPIFIDEPTSNTKTITGFTVPDANIKIDYNTVDAAHTMTGAADADGSISIALPDGDYLKTDSMLVTTSHSNWKIKTVRDIVLEGIPKILSFQYVPEFLKFQTANITNHTIIIQRENPDWSIGISDTRDQGMPWSLYVSLPVPLTSTVDNNKTLPNAILFIDEDNIKHVLNNNNYKIFSGVKEQHDNTILSWNPDKGILLEVPPNLAYATSYTAKIQWTLVDAP